MAIVTPVSATEQKQPQTVTSVESFIIKVASDEVNKEGMHEHTGYKVVDSVSNIMVVDGLPVATTISLIEDFYDLKGEYVETKIKYEEFQNDFSTGLAKTRSHVEKQFSPLNDLVNLNSLISSGKVFERLDESKEKQNYIIKKLSNVNLNFVLGEYTEVQGITYDNLKKLKESTNNSQLTEEFSELFGVSMSTSSSNCPTVNSGVEMCGAFDTYYRHNIVNGDFTVQALGESSRMYHRVHGNIDGDSARATRLTLFKANVNSYEDYIIAQMEAQTWPEVAGWFGVLTGLAQIIYGYATGPAGWLSIVLYYSGALSTFAGLTSTIYSTVSRLNLSYNAALFARNASDTINDMIDEGDDTYNYFYVLGF